MRTIYLAGPITGCDRSEANDWRKELSEELIGYGIRGISPLRCEPLVGERYSPHYQDPKFGTPRAIASKNAFDVRQCDLTLCYLPLVLHERRPSYGTIIELAWAHGIGKPTILVTDDPIVEAHPVIQACAGWCLKTLDEGVEVIIGLLNDYGRNTRA